MINKWKINKKYIKIIFNKINMFSINIEILNQIFSNFKIVGKLESNEYYNYLINNNLKIIKNSIKDNYKKISKKIIK